MGQAEEQAFVEQFVAHFAVEGFDVAILHRLSGRNVVPGHALVLSPRKDSIRGEHSVPWPDTIISGLPRRSISPRQLPSHPDARDRGVRDRRQAFAGHVIDDIEHPEAGARRRADRGTKSSDQRALGRVATRIGARVPTARQRALRLRTARPSSRGGAGKCD